MEGGAHPGCPLLVGTVSKCAPRAGVGGPCRAAAFRPAAWKRLRMQKQPGVTTLEHAPAAILNPPPSTGPQPYLTAYPFVMLVA